MEQFLIISHIFCGGTVLLLGIVQMFNRKGSQNHVLIRRIYVGAMWWICLSAFSIILFYRFSAFLLVIGVLTFYASFTGLRVVRRRKKNKEEWYDWVVTIITICFGIGLLAYGISAFFSGKAILALLSVLFGCFTAFSGFQDLRFFLRPKERSHLWMIQQHISAMGGSYIAAVTAFAVQNPNLFMPESSPQWLLWILPGVIGGFAIGRSQKHWTKKLSS